MKNSISRPNYATYEKRPKNKFLLFWRPTKSCLTLCLIELTGFLLNIENAIEKSKIQLNNVKCLKRPAILLKGRAIPLLNHFFIELTVFLLNIEYAIDESSMKRKNCNENMFLRTHNALNILIFLLIYIFTNLLEQ